MVCRDSVVGTVNCHGLDDTVIESQWGAIFSALVETDPRSHPASCTVGTGVKTAEAWR
jgi:hypothetical protein